MRHWKNSENTLMVKLWSYDPSWTIQIIIQLALSSFVSRNSSSTRRRFWCVNDCCVAVCQSSLCCLLTERSSTIRRRSSNQKPGRLFCVNLLWPWRLPEFPRWRSQAVPTCPRLRQRRQPTRPTGSLTDLLAADLRKMNRNVSYYPHPHGAISFHKNLSICTCRYDCWSDLRTSRCK